METLYESKFKKTEFDSSKSLMINHWTNADMTENDFRKEILEWAKLVEAKKPVNMIADTSKFTFLISIETQTWVGTDVFPRLIAAGMKKFAIVLPEDLISQLALEQTMDEEKSNTLQSRNFGSMADALAWVSK